MTLLSMALAFISRTRSLFPPSLQQLLGSKVYDPLPESLAFLFLLCWHLGNAHEMPCDAIKYMACGCQHGRPLADAEWILASSTLLTHL
jgi:hypothetical protein